MQRQRTNRTIELPLIERHVNHSSASTASLARVPRIYLNESQSGKYAETTFFVEQTGSSGGHLMTGSAKQVGLAYYIKLVQQNWMWVATGLILSSIFIVIFIKRRKKE